jgi:signal transduction histidine kinase
MSFLGARGGNRLIRHWSTRLWLLAALLGATTVYSGVSAIHDGDQRRLALGLITQATAMHLSVLASSRLERFALEAFAPAGPLADSRPGPAAGRATVDRLARRQRDGVACACREVLPATAFFHLDASSRRLEIAAIDSSRVREVEADSAVLGGIARTEANGPRGASSASSQLIVDPRLGDRAALVLVQRDERGEPVAVYGAVVDTRATLGTLFAAQGPHSHMDSAGLTRLDSLSLEVSTSQGRILFGALGPGRAKGKVYLGGALRGLELTISMSTSRVASPLMSMHPSLALWHLGALLAATTIVLALSVGASRRELLLARARSDFIAGVSHDLRMPLAQILIASETLSLRRERNDEERVSLASSVVRETRRLMALVDNVMLFSRSGAVELKPTLRPVPVTELLGDVADAVQLAVEDAGQSIEIVPGPATTVMGDRRLVRQALVNLVDNAIKYGAAGQRIRVGAERVGDGVRLYVEDQGPGIPKADRGRIFEPYARLAHDQVSERTGTGLGLAVVRQITVACGGRVWLEDAATRGTRAVIELATASASAPLGAAPEVA